MLFKVCLTLLLCYVDAQAKLSLIEEFEQLEALYSPERNDGLLRADPLKRKLRFSTFVHSKREIEKINNDPTKTFTAGLNKFALLTANERKMHMGLNMSANSPEDMMFSPKHITVPPQPLSTSTGFGRKPDVDNINNRDKFDGPVPDSVDWTWTQPPIKDQGDCGSCWAFGFVSALEGAYAIKTGDKVNMAEQEILECSTKAFNCERGGLFVMPAKYVMLWQRIGGTDEIPYKATYSGVCDFKKRKTKNVLKKAKLTELKGISDGDKYLQRVLATTVVGVYMTLHNDIMYYKTGNYEEPFPLNVPTHAASLVGYGKNKWGKFWKLRNSWGVGWGQDGYGYFSREFEGNSYFSKGGHWMYLVKHEDGDKIPMIPPETSVGMCENTQYMEEECSMYQKQGMCEKGARYYDFMMIKCRGTCKCCEKGMYTYMGAGFKGPEYYPRNQRHPFENGIPDEKEEQKKREEEKKKEEEERKKEEEEKKKEEEQKKKEQEQEDEEEESEKDDEWKKDRDDEKDDKKRKKNRRKNRRKNNKKNNKNKKKNKRKNKNKEEDNKCPPGLVICPDDICRFKDECVGTVDSQNVADSKLSKRPEIPDRYFREKDPTYFELCMDGANEYGPCFVYALQGHCKPGWPYYEWTRINCGNWCNRCANWQGWKKLYPVDS